MIWRKDTRALGDLLRCRDGDPEIAAIFFIDVNGAIVETHVFRGSNDQLRIPVSALLRRGSDLLCHQLLMMHTHPSGDPHPSAHDMTTTRRLALRLRGQGQRLMDHIILSRDRYFSFRANHLM
jgi:DNA repair protein RadC